LLDPAEDIQGIVDPRDAAESAGLRYVSDTRPGIRRQKAGKGFTYIRLVLEIKSQVESALRDELAGLQAEEAAVLAMLRQRLKAGVDDDVGNKVWRVTAAGARSASAGGVGAAR
jgi:DNA topoisomerase IB